MRAPSRALVVGFAALGLALLTGCPKSAPVPAPAEGGEAPPTLADASPVTATAVSPEEIAKMVNPGKLPAYTGPTGGVEGIVRVVGDPPADTPEDFHRCPSASAVWGKQFREGPPGPGGTRALLDALVAVTGYSGSFVPEKEEAELVTIEGCGFPRTVTMTFGQRLEVKNTSKEFWTPKLEPTPNKVMMMAPPGGEPVRIYPKRPGRFLLLDHDRPYANADVFVLLHPLHAVSDQSGHFRIDNVPVGKLKVSAMHPRIGTESSVDVDVRPNVIAQVELLIRHTKVDASAPPAASGRPNLH